MIFQARKFDWRKYLPRAESKLCRLGLITGDTFRPDLILYNKHNNKIHILELTVGFESNPKINSDWKLSKYRPLLTSLST